MTPGMAFILGVAITLGLIIATLDLCFAELRHNERERGR